jgi:hypothetical protein
MYEHISWLYKSIIFILEFKENSSYKNYTKFCMKLMIYVTEN